MNRCFTILFSACLVQASVSATASDFFAHLHTRFNDGNCSLYSWINDGDQPSRLEFPGKTGEANGFYSCTVKIPAPTFEKYFANCFLTGLTFVGNSELDDDSVRGINFSGIPRNTVDNTYFFEWFDAEHTYASYLCILKKQNK